MGVRRGVTCGAFFVVLALTSRIAYATPPAVRDARPARPAVRPRAALQLAGLRVAIPVPRAAVMHALARDVWPALVACVTPPPGVRGYGAVALRESGARATASVSGPPFVRSPALRACVQAAVERVVLPPYEGDPPDPMVRFDLVFDMPPIASVGPARRVAARPRPVRGAPALASRASVTRWWGAW